VGIVGFHMPQWTTTSSPTLTFSTADPTAHTTPDASEPPMWKSSGSPFFCRVLITSIGTPIAAHTLL
jgi:hypothetical protein